MLKVHKLKNNITLILDSNENSLVTSVFVGVSVGSNNEDANQHGLAHFFEHMCFKGTKEYTTSSSLDNKINSLGLYSNAATSNYMTIYHLTGNSKHLGEMIHIVSEIFINPLFPVEALEREKGVIVEEIQAYEDDPLTHTTDLELFKGTEAGHSILGTIESVKLFERSIFSEFHQRHYIADNTIIVISGKFDEDATLKKVDDEFKNARRGEATNPPVLKINKTLGNQFTSIVKKDIKQTRVTISFYSVGKDSNKAEIAELLSVVLGRSRSSRLYSSIRKGMGACYEIFSSCRALSNYGLFSIQTGISSNNFERVTNKIAIECSKLKTELIGDEELERAKQVLIGRILNGTETSISRTYYYSDEYVKTGGVTTIPEYIDRINKITATEIQDMAREIFKGDEVKIASVGDTKFEDSAVAPLLNI